MNICTEHDSEVCYDAKSCPACKLKEELDASKKENAELAEKITELKAEIEDLKGQIP